MCLLSRAAGVAQLGSWTRLLDPGRSGIPVLPGSSLQCSWEASPQSSAQQVRSAPHNPPGPLRSCVLLGADSVGPVLCSGTLTEAPWKVGTSPQGVLFASCH